MAANLTQGIVKKAKPKDKPYEIRDGKVPGLILRVQPTGRKRYVCEYRIKDPKTLTWRKTRKTIQGDPEVLTVKQAQEAAKDILKDASKGIDRNKEERDARARTLGGFIEEKYTEYAQDHISTHKALLISLKRNFEDLYSKPLNQITELDIEAWRRKRPSIKFETLQRDLTQLKACLNTAMKEFKLTSSHGLEGYTLKRRKSDPQSSPQAIRYLSEDEEIRLRAAFEERESRMRAERLSGNEWRLKRGRQALPAIKEGEFSDYLQPLVLIALNTGLRRGDLFDLEWQHVDLKRKQIRKIINKTSHKAKNPMPAVLPLSSEAFTVLNTWLKQSTGDGLVFPSPKTGERLDNITKAWRKLMKDANITAFRFHDLRHTFASRLVMGGIDLNTVRELMTHGDIKMTLVYAHLSPDHKADAIKRVFDKN